MGHAKDHLFDLDRHVQLLEGKVNKLRASLKHWQQWYFDYSALKEEVDQLPLDPPPRKELARIRRDFSSELITQKEINEIFGKNDLKDAKQILTVISRRLDYGEQNVQSLTKMLQAEENRLSAATVIAHPDGGTDEETGLPLTDIIEELDEEGNVVSFRLQSGPDASSQVAAALEKAGVDNLTETDANTTRDDTPSTPVNGVEAKEEAVATPAKLMGSLSNPKSEEAPPSAQTTKKSVSFTGDTKTSDEASKPPVSKTAQRVEELMRIARESEATDFSKAVIPETESPGDRQLRRQMLDYCMSSEMGPVVAELQIEESGFSDEDDDWDMTDEGSEDYDDDDDEDELGRSKHSVITGDYIKRMQELEKRLQSQSAFATSRQQADSTVPEGVGRVRVVQEQESEPASTPDKASREPKSVRFASALDIAKEKDTKPPLSVKSKPKKRAKPVKDIVEESLASDDAEELEDEQPKRVSRFKKERSAVSTKSGPSTNFPPGPLQLRPGLFSEPAGPVVERSEPAPPEGQTLAPAIVERNVSSTPAVPDDMDDVLLYQAAAVEYNRLRNKMIQQQGGFLKEEEYPVIPLDEDEGSAPRVSRFKAARLSKK